MTSCTRPLSNLATCAAFLLALAPRLADAGHADEVLLDNPLVYYQFEETSGMTAIDASGNGNHGTYTNGPTLGVASVADSDLGNAVDLDGVDDYVSVPNVGNHGQMSIEFWVNLDGLARSCCTSVYSTDSFNIVAGAGSHHFNIKSDRSLEHAMAGGAPQNVNSAAGTILDDTWYHVVGTYDRTDSGRTRLYVNGALVTDQMRAVLDVQLSLARIGAWALDGNRHLDGTLDEFALYDSVLSPQRVLEHYEAAFLGACCHESRDARSSACRPMTRAECEARCDGSSSFCEFLGPGTDCAGDCPVIGACRHPESELCRDGVTAQECANLGDGSGIFFPDERCFDER